MRNAFLMTVNGVFTAFEARFMVARPEYPTLLHVTPLPHPSHSHFQSQLTWHLFVLHGAGGRKKAGERGLSCANDCWGLAYFIKVSQTLVGGEVERYLYFFFGGWSRLNSIKRKFHAIWFLFL